MDTPLKCLLLLALFGLVVSIPILPVTTKSSQSEHEDDDGYVTDDSIDQPRFTTRSQEHEEELNDLSDGTDELHNELLDLHGIKSPLGATIKRLEKLKKRTDDLSKLMRVDPNRFLDQIEGLANQPMKLNGMRFVTAPPPPVTDSNSSTTTATNSSSSTTPDSNNSSSDSSTTINTSNTTTIANTTTSSTNSSDNTTVADTTTNNNNNNNVSVAIATPAPSAPAPVPAPASSTVPPVPAPASSTVPPASNPSDSVASILIGSTFGMGTSLPTGTVYKYIQYPSQPTSRRDPREGMFAWTAADGLKTHVVGGCWEATHIPGCDESILTWDVRQHIWDVNTISSTAIASKRNQGAAYAYVGTNASYPAVYDFAGKRMDTTTSSNSITNWLGKLAKTDDGWVWSIQSVSVATNSADMPPPSMSSSMSAVGSVLVVFGGFNDNDGSFSNSVYWTFTTGDDAFKWHKLITSAGVGPPAARAGHSASVLGNDIYIFGGFSETAALDDLWTLTVPQRPDVDSWKWSRVSTFNRTNQPSARRYHSAVFMPGNLLFIMGGEDPVLKTVYDDTRILDISSKYWMLPPSTLGPAPSKFKKAATTVVGDEIVLFGGCSYGSDVCNDVFKPVVLDTRAVDQSNCGPHGSYRVVQPTSGWVTPIPQCDCNADYTGKFCDIKHSCPLNCSSRGSCSNGVCDCNPGFGGDGCELLVCPNGCGGTDRGYCDKETKRCICSMGHWGLDCGFDNCPENCHGHGTCQIPDAMHNKTWCKCAPGFQGDACQFWAVANATKAYQQDYMCPSHCSGHGICVRKQIGIDVTGVCECEDGFGGYNCAGECTHHCGAPARGSCPNNGSPSEVKCECKKGYKGPGCMETECYNNCNGNGNCYNNNITASCYCKYPWSGADCSVDASCSKHGQFSNGQCTCDAGWGGVSCNITVTCKDDCNGNGKCYSDASGGDSNVVQSVCRCNPGYTGKLCNQIACPKDCSTNGVCNDGKCECYAGYAGEDCSVLLKCPNNCTDATRGTCTSSDNYNTHANALQLTSTSGSSSSSSSSGGSGFVSDIGRCVCKPGWGGSACDEVGCPFNCYNRGQCFSGKCLCEDGYSGPACEMQCPNKCSSNGICIDGSCRCRPGYTGADCSVQHKCPVNSKTNLECSGTHGVCFRAAGRCICAPGYGGSDCSIVRGCGLEGCGTHGVCSNNRCYCDPGWEGIHCEQQAKCQNDCNGRGFCQHGKCWCSTGFKGAACEEFVVDGSCPNNCSSHGVCQYGRCFCSVGYAGNDCSVSDLQGQCRKTATSALCEGRGECAFGQCFCHPGFAGPHCENKEKCKYGCDSRQGVCMAGRCHCLPGFQGTDCSEDLTCEGSPLPCTGNGVCIQGNCACLPGYSGPACEKTTILPNSPCPKDCNNHGVCHLGRCFCVDGWKGSDCSVQVQGTCPRDCSGRGACVFGQCFCRPGYGGKACQIPLTCHQKCLENGVCAFGKCFCVSGWTGINCDIRVDAKEAEAQVEKDILAAMKLSRDLTTDKDRTDYCVGGCGTEGVCINHTCVCTGAFYGPQCQHVRMGALTSRCPNNCNQQGQCVLGKCICKPGFAGLSCETTRPFLCTNQCSNKGFCYYGRCYCDPGFEGTDCSTEVKDNGCFFNGHGLWLSGRCQCVKGFTGPYCNITVSSTETLRFKETTEMSSIPLSMGSLVGAVQNQKLAQATAESQSAQKDAIPASQCSKDCGKNGACVNKECYCKSGFSGLDCTVEVAKMAANTAAVTPVNNAAKDNMDSTESDRPAHVSYLLMGSMGFVAGLIVCLLGLVLYDRYKEHKRQATNKNILKPFVLHTIDN